MAPRYPPDKLDRTAAVFRKWRCKLLSRRCYGNNPGPAIPLRSSLSRPESWHAVHLAARQMQQLRCVVVVGRPPHPPPTSTLPDTHSCCQVQEPNLLQKCAISFLAAATAAMPLTIAPVLVSGGVQLTIAAAEHSTSVLPDCVRLAHTNAIAAQAMGRGRWFTNTCKMLVPHRRGPSCVHSAHCYAAEQLLLLLLLRWAAGQTHRLQLFGQQLHTFS